MEHIGNEAEVRYVLVNPIVGMFCNSFNHMELEDTIDESETWTNMSGQSKADNVCWVLRAYDHSKRLSYSGMDKCCYTGNKT